MAATMLIPSQQGSPPLVEGSENLSFQRLDRRGEVEMARLVRLVMSRRPQNFRLAELTKILKAMLRAGIRVDRVELDNSGALQVFSRKEETSQSENEWDSVK